MTAKKTKRKKKPASRLVRVRNLDCPFCGPVKFDPTTRTVSCKCGICNDGELA